MSLFRSPLAVAGFLAACLLLTGCADMLAAASAPSSPSYSDPDPQANNNDSTPDPSPSPPDPAPAETPTMSTYEPTYSAPNDSQQTMDDLQAADDYHRADNP